MMKTLFTLLICVGFLVPAMAQLSSHNVSLELNGGELYGTLVSPSVAEPVPLVIIVSGSGPTDRDGNNPMMKNNSLKLLADAFLQSNIASLRYDKRGVAASKALVKHEEELRFDDYVNDLRAWVDKYKADERFSEIIICGHSEGALVGALAAQDEMVSKYISIAGATLPAADVLRDQLAAQPAILQMATPIIAQLEQGQLYANPPAMLNSLFRPSVQPYLISWFKYAPQAVLSKLNLPILLVQGTTDIQVKIEDFRAFANAHAVYQQHVVEGMNHVLKEAPLEPTANMATYANPNLALHPKLMPKIIAFIKK